MNRADLIGMIYDDNTVRSCHPEETKCELTDARINSQMFCKQCAEAMLTEYENKIRTEARAKVIEEVSSLITQRLKENCDKASCDDCEQCCEVSALTWLDKQLKEQR